MRWRLHRIQVRQTGFFIPCAHSVGAALGYQAIPERWLRGLWAGVELEEKIETFIARFA